MFKYRYLLALLLVVISFIFILPSLQAQEKTPGLTLFTEYRSQSPKTFQFETQVPPFGIEHQVRLSLDARIDWNQLFGSNPWMIVKINGSALSSENLLNKTDRFSLRSGLELTWYRAANNAWRVLYSPDFEAARTSPVSSVPVDTDPYHFVWDITPYVRPGKNIIEINHLQLLPESDTLVLRNGQIEVGRPIAPPASDAMLPAPTGPLSHFGVHPTPRLSFQISGAPGVIRLKDKGYDYVVRTRTSLPAKEWWQPATETIEHKNPTTPQLSWQTSLYTVQRRLERQPHRVVIRDTYTNRTDRMIGVLVENQIAAPAPAADIYLAGRPAKTDSLRFDSGSNPSVFVGQENGGIGLLAEGDVFRAHATLLRDGQNVSLADQYLGLAPNASVTLQWAIYPTPRGAYPRGDYWDFVNAVRTDWNTNFTIPGPYAFVSAQNQKTIPETGQWLTERSLKYICGGIAKYPDGKYAHGTGILHAPQFVANEKEWVNKVHQASPGTKVLCYFHSQISTEPNFTTKFAADRNHNIDGAAVVYPYRYELPLFIPTDKNNYGKALWGFVKTITETIGADGLYWDEMSHSVNEYATDTVWDGYSAQIDLQTHQLIKPLSNVPLMTQNLKLQILDYLKANNKYFLANTQAQTQTLSERRFVRFVETGTLSHLYDAQLECPLGLADIPENNQKDAAQNLRNILAKGCHYYGHSYQRDAAKWDFIPLLYPMTPQRIGPGYIIGKERIVTNASGYFSFEDGARADIYQVDENGDKVIQTGVREQLESGHFQYEVRIPSNHFVILVRR